MTLSELWLSGEAAFASPELAFALRLTAQVCVLAGIGFFLIAPPLAWAFARKKAASVRAASFLVMLPLVFPPIALGYILMLLLGRQGPFGGLLQALDVSILFTPTACALAAFTAGLPLVVRPLQAAFASERLKELEESAALCGAKPRTVFFHITLPVMRPQLLSGLLLGTSRAMGEVGITMMVGGNIAGKTNTLSLEIFNAVSRADFDAASWLCLLLSGATLLIFFILDQMERRTTPL